VFCDWCRIKSGRRLRVKVAVIIQVKGEEKKEEEEEEEKKEVRTAALGGVKRLNRAQIIQRRLQIIKESDEQIIVVINKL
jgi:hypothetical protein